jgi:hypothetical protein
LEKDTTFGVFFLGGQKEVGSLSVPNITGLIRLMGLVDFWYEQSLSPPF